MDPLDITLLSLLAASAIAATILGIGWSRLRGTHESHRVRAEEREHADAERIASLDAEARELRDRAETLERDAATLREQIAGAERLHEQAMESQRRVLDAERKAIEQQREALEKRINELNTQTAERFKSLAGDALTQAREELNRHAAQQREAAEQTAKAELDKRREAVEQLVKPIRETLTRTDEKLVQLNERVEQSSSSAAMLREETAKLSRALSRPEVRGRYGEIQLRRVAELAGMTSYCDFEEQASIRDSDGKLQRPDMLVRLPNDRVIAVDAKTNIDAYLEAVNATEEAERERHLDRFATHIAEQAKQLGAKQYWSLFDMTPEFVVMFVPGDHFIDAALARKPAILESAAQQGVILTSPSTLIGLLRAVAVGWRESKLAEDARELLSLGAELHERAAVAFDHAQKVGDSLRQAVERYNKLAGSIDSRLLPTLRKFEEAGVKSAKPLPEPKEITSAVTERTLTDELDIQPKLTGS